MYFSQVEDERFSNGALGHPGGAFTGYNATETFSVFALILPSEQSG